MLQTLALAAALSLAPAQPGALALTNDRIVVGGQFGLPRADDKFMPGDVLFLTFDIENLKVDAGGNARYALEFKVLDPTGAAVYAPPAGNFENWLPLGGNKLSANAFYGIDPTQAAGKYTSKITVTDLATGATKALEKSFQVTPPGFGVVALRLTHDFDGNLPAPFTLVAGQAAWLHFGVAGFARDPKSRQPDVTAELRVIDKATGQPTLQKPKVRTVKNLPLAEPGLGFDVALPLNRAGSFTVELKIDCKVSNKSSKMTFPITVLEPSK